MSWHLDAATAIEVQGRFWRMLAPKWSHAPLSGDGAAQRGGRWNPPGRPALYLSYDHPTAIAEYHQNLPRPGTLTAYDVDAGGILDLTSAAQREATGIEDALLRLPWKRLRDIEHRRPESWDLAEALIAADWTGARVPSTQVAGTNLVLWRWNDGSGAAVRCFDPQGDLPRDGSSWPR